MPGEYCGISVAVSPAASFTERATFAARHHGLNFGDDGQRNGLRRACANIEPDRAIQATAELGRFVADLM